MPARLTSEEKALARQLFRSRWSQRRIAARLGRSQHAVSRAVRGEPLPAGLLTVADVGRLIARGGEYVRRCLDIMPPPDVVRGRKRYWTPARAAKCAGFLTEFATLPQRWKRSYCRLTKGERRTVCELGNEGRTFVEIARLTGLRLPVVAGALRLMEIRSRYF